MPDSDETLSLLQGTLDVLVLKSLEEQPRHGYGVAQWISAKTDQVLEIEEGALYTALHRLEKRGWLRSQWGISDNNRRAKFYRLTAGGRRQLTKKEQTWERYAEAVSKVLRSPRTERSS